MNVSCNKTMETMEIVDPESQMMVLQDNTLVEGAEQLNDEVEDLSNSLREVIQDGAVKPKLHCLMMDPSFSMVTVQSEDSGIVWETASSRCSTPWASELNATAPEPSYTLTSPGTAGKIVFFMDEELMTRKKRKQKAEKMQTTPTYISHEVMRPAMVEVSLPNVTQTEGKGEDKKANTKEEKRQRLFSLVSEGSEILNIIVPPKVSTVDEEESKGLEDHLFYLEETPAVKSTNIPDEPVNIYAAAEEIKADNTVISMTSEPLVLVPPIMGSRRSATTEDYFEKFTLLDNQTPPEKATAEAEHQEVVCSIEDKVTSKDDSALEQESGLSDVSLTISMLDITGEHLDDVFYGGGIEPHCHDNTASAREKTFQRQLSKSSLKESGTALFGSEESVLIPIYLPEGPPKIIDPNLLEEPKAMAFLYSDLYANAVGSRKRQDDDDAASATSEKSFHSQESDSEDRGYLEKFVLKVENVVAESDMGSEVHTKEQQDSFRLTGYVEHPKTEVEMKAEELEEITDFFRNSASSSPCEPLDLDQCKPEEETEVMRTPRVSFKDVVTKNKPDSNEAGKSPLLIEETDFGKEFEFLPVEINENCPAWEENLQTFSAVETAVKPTSTRTDKFRNKPKSISKTSKEFPKSIQITNTVKPIIPRHKPFLDLTPLLPAEPEKQKTEDEMEKEDKSFNGSQETRPSEAETEERTEDDLDHKVLENQEKAN